MAEKVLGAEREKMMRDQVIAQEAAKGEIAMLTMEK